ncbi:MAG: NisI/SpaI family lantibiotic immunity lipoprotein [Lachnospiraceae bacterium]|nr:NisI/SpaI family lantibiotic immunity lipoprotein [Lachnospiraceae bacterium]MDD3417437.1 NisI/SpaI family lantibiotic immunity lipoprotein [Lachnospiraceae bacterium]
MNKKFGFVGVFIIAAMCGLLAGCSLLQEKINEYSSGKEPCSLNTENVTQFFYQSESYTILDETVSNASLGDWIGYIRQLVAIDRNGKILMQEDIEKATFQSLADLADRTPDAAYLIPFLNVYAAPNDVTYLIVDANGGYHKAISTDALTDDMSIFDFTSEKQTVSGKFEINTNNATQLICDDVVYQVTSEIVPDHQLSNYLAILAQNITFDADTGKPLTKDELNKVDWSGTGSAKRENWFYKDVYEVSGIATTEAVAVKVNNKYYLATAQ